MQRTLPLIFLTTAFAAAATQDLQYGNHIFNAIHSSMRQWGSSLNHNGMSAFIATVPAGTEFYHGTSSPYRVNGTEWLAFEPEHALIFARGRGGGPPGHGGGPPKPPPHGAKDNDVTWHDRSPHGRVSPFNVQRPIETQDYDDKPADSHGYLHTYVTKHALRLLYLDGQSAAKSQKGTLDTQDVVILQFDPTTFEKQDNQPHHGPMGEYERASGLCKMAHEDWDDNIDGILRMEGGFEIILCSFEKHLEVKNIVQTKAEKQRRGPGGPPGAGMDYYRAVAARYDGIGGDRVQVDYDNFVSLFATPEAMYFDDTGRPRARNGSAELDGIRAEIGGLTRAKKDGQRSTNWQAVVDMVVTRYADRIEYMATGSFETLEAFESELNNALRPFVDYSARNATLEISRCSSQFLPKTSGKLFTPLYSVIPSTNPMVDHTTLAAQAILRVTTELCSTLSNISTSLSIPSTSLAASQLQLQKLMTWLGWTTWKKCRGCEVNEVCFLPIWPQGSEEDFEKPRCRGSVLEVKGGYWGGFGGPKT